MKQAVMCFFLDPTDDVSLWLRRYVSSENDTNNRCPTSGLGYHNASVEIGREYAPRPDNRPQGDTHRHDDLRWPQRCSCGYEFKDNDEWQIHRPRLYRRRDTRETMTKDQAPAGAMWDSWWNQNDDHYRMGEDGMILEVKLPNGTIWTIDGPATPNGKIEPCPWSRTGQVPLVTVHPSINTPTWHGWLRNGILSLDGRYTFEI